VTDDAAVQQLVAAFMDAWNRHDGAAFAALFTEDADFTNVAGVALHGRTRIQAFHAKAFGARFKDSHQSADRVAMRWVTPEVAVVDIRWGMTGVHDETGAERPPRNGLMSWVVSAVGGQWAIQVLHNQELGHVGASPGAPAPASGTPPTS
jgi:uncharacterized protein (TIGR02246 family)